MSFLRRLEVRDDPTENCLALVMAGGNGSRLGSLTSQECKPALSFAGSYRNIDFTLSNCVNSGIRKIAVLTQYNAHSLLHHITNQWGFLSPQLGEFVELWPAQKRTDDDWYLGTANAIQQNRDLIVEHAPKYTLILAGDHVYKMDYEALLQFHSQRDADVTVGSIEVPLSEASSLGIMGVDTQQSIYRFDEKPCSPRPIPGCKDKALASMGIYLFNTQFLLDTLALDASNKHSSHDFGKDILPWAIAQPAAQVFAFPFRDPNSGSAGYWRDVGTVDSYWQAQMDLLAAKPPLDLFDSRWPIMGCKQSAVPARVLEGAGGEPSLIMNSILSGGCLLQGARVDTSVLSSDVQLGSGSLVEYSVLLPGAQIGQRCHLNRVIVDSNCRVPDGTVIDGRLESGSLGLSSVNGIVLLNNTNLANLQAMRSRPVPQVA